MADETIGEFLDRLPEDEWTSAYGTRWRRVPEGPAPDLTALEEEVQRHRHHDLLDQHRVLQRELEEERRHCAALRAERDGLVLDAMNLLGQRGQLECELEEERRTSAALRDERDRLRNELGEVCEERDALRRGVRAIGQTVLKDRRRIAFDDSGGSDGR